MTLESGLSRVRAHMLKQSIGIISAATGEPCRPEQLAPTAKRFRELGYAPIQAIGESIKGEIATVLYRTERHRKTFEASRQRVWST
jgi:hypothetical protein